MKKMIMIADDLTGACDAGVQFTQKGFKTVVCFDKESANGIQADVIVLDTNSRALPQHEAYCAVKDTVAHLKAEELGLIYKKIDSTLRGNLGIELDALMDSLAFDFAVIAPALPSLGRTTKEGIHYLHEVPIELTEIANDPKTPVKDSTIINLLSMQSRRGASLFPKYLLKENKNSVLDHVIERLEKKDSLFVCDAESETDLKEIVNAFSRLPYKILWIGSAGLAEWLPAGQRQISRSPNFEPDKKQLPVLVVAGSRSGVAKKQVDTLLRSSDIKQVLLSVEMLPEEDNRDSEIYRCQEELNRYLIKGLDVVLHVDQGSSVTDDLPSLIEASLSQIVSVASRDIKLNGIVLTGGDTAKAICKELGVTGIELIDEVERGLPLSRMIGGPGLLTVTKAGAFGTDSSLHHAVKRLKGDL
ncbi:four-carbon acid sugar kinase family protein [Fictibacillus barbaricus]|uniref:Four-carbon acid sugar kinase family protein n=1 Tax=Fictibacillus barbaricus TaxID=182136 RepID=A0ABS2ZEJ6_9BACL|nr:four-carbon acid sugar kinase family protein [Fictibacillus barbaricus]MBN3546608.1 four-carbon acid sugar kinase family protein [Fictibacillus barbaricus]GGB42375.1 membrane protein [Fictibacillus barbaricus]